MPISIAFIFIFIFGLIWGSFINCWIWRLHAKESMWNRSRCPKCRQQIAWYDNIPLLSFIWLKARCRHCHQKISWQYFFVELITGVLFVISFFIVARKEGIIQAQYIDFALFLDYKFLLLNIRNFFIICIMTVIFIYDLRWYLILDVVSLPASLILLIINLLLGYGLWNLIFSGIIGSSFFLLQFLISRGKWIGGGDIRLGLLMGFALGWPLILLALLISYVIGAFSGILLIISKKKQWGSQIPFGVFLSTGTVIVLFWGLEIWQLYWKYLGF